jgi:MFS family permease
VALSNTTLGVLMATINSSIVIISLPAIFRGIHLQPLEPGNVSYLLWTLMGFLVVTAVLVVTLGRLGDMYGRVRIYNAGFVVFTLASIALAFDPLTGGGGGLWLILWRLVQGVGAAMLFANSTAILTDAFPPERRGFALGINQVAAIAGGFIGLIAGGLLSEVDWRLVFFVSVPVGVLGTVWAYVSLHELGERHRARIDWWGNALFAVGLSGLLAAITYGIQPYGGHSMGWTNPWVLFGLIGGLVLLVAFSAVEARVAEPMFAMSLFRIRAFWAGNLAGLLASIARGGLQFMLIIWLQGIWLPLHGYDFADTPLWAGIYLLPLTGAFLVAGPVSGALADKFGARAFATGGLLLVAGSFLGLMLLPVDFNYAAFAALLVLNGIGSGLFSAPNTTAIMNSVPARQRGAASGMRATFFNSGTSLSIGVFFSLMIAGLAASLPTALHDGLSAHGVPSAAAAQVAHQPPVGSLFAAFLGDNPIKTLLGNRTLSTVPPADRATLTGHTFFPHLIAHPFHTGLIIVFAVAVAMSIIGALASLLRGGKYVHTEIAVSSEGPPIPAEHARSAD